MDYKNLFNLLLWHRLNTVQAFRNTYLGNLKHRWQSCLQGMYFVFIAIFKLSTFYFLLEILPERNWVSRAKLSHSKGILVTGCWNYGPGSQNTVCHPRILWNRWKKTWTGSVIIPAQFPNFCSTESETSCVTENFSQRKAYLHWKSLSQKYPEQWQNEVLRKIRALTSHFV